jgi:hypothetical protein
VFSLVLAFQGILQAGGIFRYRSDVPQKKGERLTATKGCQPAAHRLQSLSFVLNIKKTGLLLWLLSHTNHGDIVIKTFDDKAPATVANFLEYCREGFYDNTIFHRVINSFMIQGGGFEPGMKQKETKAPIQKRSQ